MAEVTQKIAALKKKIVSRKNKLEKLDKRITASKSEYKSVKKEIDDLNDEIRRLELEQLSETLEQNGITAADITAAIADGSIKKTAPETESTELTKNDNFVSGKVANGDTYITEKSSKEDAANEISGS